MDFEELQKQFKEYQEKHKVVFKPEPLLPTSTEFLRYILNLCETESEEELRKDIYFSYQRVFDLLDTTNQPDRELMLQIVTNSKFLIAVSKILGEKTKISASERCASSKLYLMMLQNMDVSGMDKLYPLYYSIAKIANRRTVLTLLGINSLSEDNAVLISAARYCSNSLQQCAKNTVYAFRSIAKSGKDLSVEILVKIFEIIIEMDLSSLSGYFNYVMLNGPLLYEDNEMDKNLTMAMLYFVENLPTNQISSILMEYVRAYNYEIYNNHPICFRMTFRAILTVYQEKFPRIAYVLNNMLACQAFQNFGLKVPE